MPSLGGQSHKDTESVPGIPGDKGSYSSVLGAWHQLSKLCRRSSVTRDAPWSPLTSHGPGLEGDAERGPLGCSVKTGNGDLCGSNNEWLSWDSPYETIPFSTELSPLKGLLDINVDEKNPPNRLELSDPAP